MKIEIKSDVTEQQKEIHDVDSIACNRLFVDSDGWIGVISYPNINDDSFVIWFDSDGIAVDTDYHSIGLPVRYLERDKRVILTNNE